MTAVPGAPGSPLRFLSSSASRGAIDRLIAPAVASSISRLMVILQTGLMGGGLRDGQKRPTIIMIPIAACQTARRPPESSTISTQTHSEADRKRGLGQ